MDDLDLSRGERKILRDLYRNGDNVPANIAENADLHSKSVSRCLSGDDESLEDRGLVRNKGRGVYTLTKEGLKLAQEL